MRAYASRAPLVAVLVLAVMAASAGCAGFRPRAAHDTPALRVSDHRSEGDAVRRASTQLVLTGLDADLSGQSERAQSQFELALAVDPNNPYAYLALARHFADGPEPERALPFLDRAEALFGSQEPPNPAVRIHLSGLRGQVGTARSPGSAVSRQQLEEAARLAPDIWGDGRLSADEMF